MNAPMKGFKTPAPIQWAEIFVLIGCGLITLYMLYGILNLYLY